MKPTRSPRHTAMSLAFADAVRRVLADPRPVRQPRLVMRVAYHVDRRVA